MELGSPHAASAARAPGDPERDRFAQLYEHHFDGIYDFAARIVGDRDLAGDVVHNTFVKAWERLGKADVRSEKAWLYAVARNEAIDELRRRKRVVSGGGEDGPLYTAVDPARASDPELAAADSEMVALVWDAARGLTPDEYSLLDMNLRRGLDADEISAALGLQKGAVYTRLSRLKDALESSVVATLLMRRGRDACDELDTLLSELGASEQPTPEARRAVERHVKDCETCQASRRRFASPAAIFSGLAPIPALPGAREAIWSALAPQVGRQPPVPPQKRSAPRTRMPRWLALGATATVAVLAAAVAAGLLAAGEGERAGSTVSTPDAGRPAARGGGAQPQLGEPATLHATYTSAAGTERYAVRVTVESIRPLPPPDAAGAVGPRGSHWVGVYATLENVGAVPYSGYESSDAKLATSTGKEAEVDGLYEIDPACDGAAADGDVIELAPGRTTKVCIPYVLEPGERAVGVRWTLRPIAGESLDSAEWRVG